MNSSLWSAGRNTHLKIIAVALMASIVVVVIGVHFTSRERDKSNRGKGRPADGLYRQPWTHDTLSGTCFSCFM